MTPNPSLIGAGALLFATLPLTVQRRRVLRSRLTNQAGLREPSPRLRSNKTGLDALDEELLGLLAVLPLLLRGGLSSIKALEWCSIRAVGELAREIRMGLDEIALGESEGVVLGSLANRLHSSSVREFSIKVRSALHRGNRLAEMLQSQAAGVEGRLRAAQIAAAARAESRMMMPLVFVILPVTIGVALLPSVTAISQFT